MKVIDMFVQKAETRRWEARVRRSLGPGEAGPEGGGKGTTIDVVDQWGGWGLWAGGLLNDRTFIFFPS